MSSQPLKYRVYTIVERAGGGQFWLKLGNAVAHKDGKGLTMSLPAVPLTGQLVVRQYDDEADEVSNDTEEHERAPAV